MGKLKDDVFVVNMGQRVLKFSEWLLGALKGLKKLVEERSKDNNAYELVWNFFFEEMMEGRCPREKNK